MPGNKIGPKSAAALKNLKFIIKKQLLADGNFDNILEPSPTPDCILVAKCNSVVHRQAAARLQGSASCGQLNDLAPPKLPNHSVDDCENSLAGLSMEDNTDNATDVEDSITMISLTEMFDDLQIARSDLDSLHPGQDQGQETEEEEDETKTEAGVEDSIYNISVGCGPSVFNNSEFTEDDRTDRITSVCEFDLCSHQSHQSDQAGGRHSSVRVRKPQTSKCESINCDQVQEDQCSIHFNSSDTEDEDKDDDSTLGAYSTVRARNPLESACTNNKYHKRQQLKLSKNRTPGPTRNRFISSEAMTTFDCASEGLQDLLLVDDVISTRKCGVRRSQAFLRSSRPSMIKSKSSPDVNALETENT